MSSVNSYFFQFDMEFGICLSSSIYQMSPTYLLIMEGFFTFKDNLPKMLRSGLVYKYKCGGCNAKTNCHFKFQICEYLRISHLTGKKVKIDKNKLKVIQQHLLFCNNSPVFEDFSILTTKSNGFKFEIMKIYELSVTSICLAKRIRQCLWRLFYFD